MKPFIIAEVGQAHDGSLGMLHSYIDALAETGVDAIKFQTHIADAESSIDEPFRVRFSYEDNTRYDYWKRMEFTKDQWHGIKKHCDDKDVEFMSSPFSNQAVDLLEELGVHRYKIGSGEITNYLMLDKIAKTGKDIILSSGMSSYDELDAVFGFLGNYKNNLSVLQCTTEYPTTAQSLGLNVMAELKERYSVPVGLSDHSGSIYASLAAVTLGAEIIEFHSVYDRRQFGPDSKASLEIDEIRKLLDGVNFITSALNAPVDKTDIEKYSSVKSIFEKSLSINKNKSKGEYIKLEDLESKKPSRKGIPAHRYQEVVGKRLLKDLCQWDFIKNEDIVW